jgi:hypothetical protein
MKVDFVFVLFALYEGCSAAKLGVDECQTKLSDLATQHNFNITQVSCINWSIAGLVI